MEGQWLISRSAIFHDSRLPSTSCSDNNSRNFILNRKGAAVKSRKMCSHFGRLGGRPWMLCTNRFKSIYSEDYRALKRDVQHV
jgi:hypothetical protein